MATEVRVFSTVPPDGKEYFRSDSIYIFKNGKPQTGKNRFSRLLQYFSYYFYTSFKLFKYRPDTVMYFETLSFLPVFFYCWINNLRGIPIRIFCHYHEYTSPKEYKDGMLINRLLHILEKKWYHKMEWISHTNIDRMTLFKSDVSLQQSNNTYVLANYPPQTWLKVWVSEEIGFPIRFVYVGALGMNTMYIREFVEWIELHDGKFEWDVFSQQDGKEFVDFLETKEVRHTKFRGYVSYNDLPSLLKKYDVGVILYKGHIPNYVYNVPNKLFEYMACGLDTWFPKEMQTSLQYVNTHTRPKVIAVDFDKLSSFDETQALTRQNIPYIPSIFFSEKELGFLWSELTQDK